MTAVKRETALFPVTAEERRYRKVSERSQSALERQWHGRLRSSDQAIVIRVGSDPKPKHAVLHFDGERAAVETDA
jgi:hypothetical protein